MPITRFKDKFDLSEDDINLFAAWIIEGRSLEEIFHYFSPRMDVSQIYVLASVISKDMYDMPLSELAPELVLQRRNLNKEDYDSWQKKKSSQVVMSLLQDISEDLSLFDMELNKLIAQNIANKDS